MINGAPDGVRRKEAVMSGEKASECAQPNRRTTRTGKHPRKTEGSYGLWWATVVTPFSRFFNPPHQRRICFGTLSWVAMGSSDGLKMSSAQAAALEYGPRPSRGNRLNSR